MSNMHVFDVAISIDTDGIAEQIAKNAVAKGVNEIIRIVKEEKLQQYYDGNRALANEIVDEAAKELIGMLKNEIIEAAATKLAASVRNSRAFKEKIESV